MSGTGTTYLLVDGENIDATLGLSVLGRRPGPEERPRWDRVREFAAGIWQQPVVPLFFLNASNGQLPMPERCPTSPESWTTSPECNGAVPPVTKRNEGNEMMLTPLSRHIFLD